ncbi:transporter substrate-binding domain-containing protein [Microvirga sp. P5_D2]
MNISRRMMMAAIGAGLMVGAMASSAAAQTVDDIKKAGTIKVGMLVDFPPFGLMNANNEPDGYDADVAKLLGKEWGVKVQIVPVSGPNRIPYLQSGQVDILIAGLGITEERKKTVDYSQPYAGIAIGVFGAKGVNVTKAEDLAGKRVAVARASTQDTAMTKIAPPNTAIQRFDDDASAVQALLSGQVELMGVSNVVFSQIEKAAPGRYDQKFIFNQQLQGIAIRKNTPELQAALNAFITKHMADGQLEAIHQKWLGSPLPQFVKEAKN